MAGNFWQSSHYEQWIMEKADLLRGRADDLRGFTEEEYQKIMIFFTEVIHQLASNSQLGPKTRMQAIATACVYFRRFYSRRSLKDIDPFLLAPTCLFLASKAEEHGVLSPKALIMCVPQACSAVHSSVDWHVLSPFVESLKRLSMPSSEMASRVALLQEAEFILLEILDCCLVVYQPYRPLKQIINDLKESIGEAKYLEELEANAWRICNDSLKTDACLLYAPHLIAIASVQVAAIVMNREKDLYLWFAELNADYEKVYDINQMIFAMYKNAESIKDKDALRTLIERIPKGSAAPLY